MDGRQQPSSGPRPYTYTELARMWLQGEWDRLNSLDPLNLQRLDFVIKRIDRKPHSTRRRFIGGVDV